MCLTKYVFLVKQSEDDPWVNKIQQKQSLYASYSDFRFASTDEIVRHLSELNDLNVVLSSSTASQQMSTPWKTKCTAFDIDRQIVFFFSLGIDTFNVCFVDVVTFWLAFRLVPVDDGKPFFSVDRYSIFTINVGCMMLINPPVIFFSLFKRVCISLLFIDYEFNAI